ncbi:MAG: DUF4294 domain-containing protein [Bacteroidales bacterium]|nr:DUF4294 domain-containing protein [Bacteroidales bacterium]
MSRYKLTYILLLTILLAVSPKLTAQTKEKDNSGVTRVVIEGSDTIPIIELPELRVYDRRELDYLYLKRKYRRLIRNVKKAYPYSKIAGEKLQELDDQLASIDNEKEQKEHVKKAEKEILGQFEKEVRKLTVTQGIILVKLIDRETGRSSYQVIKELKGSITAFFWQGIARIFGNNLKAEYDPEGDDKVIEDIVRGIEAGFI